MKDTTGHTATYRVLAPFENEARSIGLNLASLGGCDVDECEVTTERENLPPAPA